MGTPLNADAQPTNPWFNFRERSGRDISEMLGLVKGLLADGVLTDPEILAIKQWLVAHRDLQSEWCVKTIADRIENVLADGTITEDERADLLDIFNQLTGGGIGVIGKEQLATQLPVDQGHQPISVPGKKFVFTGKFAFGPRKKCEEVTTRAGGVCAPKVTNDTNYLVIGTFASRDWKETSYGTKIESAMDKQQRGQSVSVITEDLWAEAIYP
jgi:NAD-dependent DNA ligase